MKKNISAFLSLILALCMVLSLCACQNVPSGEKESDRFDSEETEQDRFDSFTEALFQEKITGNLIDLHYMVRNPENYGISQYECSFGDFSLKALQDSVSEDEALKKELGGFSYEKLSEDQKHTYDILSWLLDSNSFSEELLLYTEPLGLVSGVHTNFPIILSEYTFSRRQDVEDYLTLLSDTQRYFTQVMEFEKAKSAAGLFMCDEVADRVISACHTFCENPEENYMISSFDHRIDQLTELSDGEKTAYKEKNRELVLRQFLPAYDILTDGLEALKGTGTNQLGLCGLPKGKEYARYLLTSYTGSNRTAKEYEALLMEKVNDGLSRMGELMRQYPSLSEQADTFRFGLTDPAQILLDLQEKMKEDFPALPTDAAYTIKYVPAALEDSVAPAYYMTPPVDGYGDNVIYINKSQLDPASLYSTLSHEGYPGHLYQFVYSRNVISEPLRFLLNLPGFSEGWASYVELQSYYWDSSLSEPLAELMSLNNEITLELYCLMDLYINCFGYDPEDTAAFLGNYFGISDQETVTEVYYYIAGEPLNYLKYGGGLLEFSALREKAEEALGSRFSAKAFHQFLMEAGEAPFPVVEKWMDAWIQEQ